MGSTFGFPLFIFKKKPHVVLVFPIVDMHPKAKMTKNKHTAEQDRQQPRDILRKGHIKAGDFRKARSHRDDMGSSQKRGVNTKPQS